MNPSLFHAAVVLLVLFTVLAAVDGLYIHLWKLRLHTRPESRREHWLHTARSALFPIFTVGLFVLHSAGPLLWAAVVVAAADTVLELWDVFSEKDSRALIGGLGSFEYVVHVALTSLRAGSIALVLGARPASAWALGSPLLLETSCGVATTIATNLVPGAVLVAIVHVWLALRGDTTQRTALASPH